MIRIGLFGKLAAYGPFGTVDHFGTQRSAKVLALLALSRGALARDSVADLLWPDDFPDATRLRLRQELSRLRRALESASDLLEADTESLRLDRGRVQSDLDILRRTVEQFDGSPDRRGALVQALAQAAGEFLPGWDDPWVLAERTTADDLKLKALTLLAEDDLTRGNPSAALERVEEATRLDPCHEPSRIVAIRAHAALGSLANAMAEFQRMKRRLAERQERPSQAIEELLTTLRAPIPETNTPPAATPLQRVPVPLEPIFGREGLLADLHQRTQASRLVTLVGPGGIGKTRLALEWARSAPNAAFVGLAEVGEGADVLHECLRSLGHQPPGGGDLARYLAGVLGSQPWSLVIDNIEHLLPRAATELKRALEACPSLRLVVTSRIPLRIGGEDVLTVTAIPSEDDAVAMLMDLWRGVRPTLAITDDTRTQARLLVKALDCYPLAIRLASARLKLRNPADLAREFAASPEALHSSSPDLSERHRSLNRALTWSLQQLAEGERRMLVVLSAFRGGCPVEEILPLVPEHSLLEVESLVDAALVVLDEAGVDLRIRMLEPIRQYIQLTADAQAQAQAVLRQWGESVVEEELPGEWPATTWRAIHRLDREHENLQPLADNPDVGAALAHYGTMRGRSIQGLALLDRLPPSERHTLLRAQLLMALGREREAIANLRAALEGSLTGDNRLRAMVLLGRSLRRIDLQEANVWTSAAVEAQSTGLLRAEALGAHGIVRWFLNDADGARALLTEALSIFVAVGDDRGQAITGPRLSAALKQCGQIHAARRALDESRPLVERFGDPGALAYLDELDGRIRLELGDGGGAEAAFRSALERWTQLGNGYQMTDQRTSMVRALLLQGRTDEVRSVLVPALQGWIAENDMGGLEATLTRVADLHVQEGSPLAAARALAVAADLQREHATVLVTDELVYREDLMRAAGLSAPEPLPWDLDRILELLES